jgi:hypothetical protein
LKNDYGWQTLEIGLEKNIDERKLKFERVNIDHYEKIR